MEARSMPKSSKLGCKILQNPLKMCPSEVQNRAKRRLGKVLGCLGVSWRHLGAFWRRLGASWEHLGASWERLGGVLGVLGSVLGPSWEGSWALKSTKIKKKSVKKPIIFLIGVKTDLSWILDGFWRYLGFQNQWKIDKKMDLKSDWILHWFLIDFLLIFEATWLQDNMADIAKTLKNALVFFCFCYIGKMSWVCGCMAFGVGFFIDFSLILGVKIY